MSQPLSDPPPTVRQLLAFYLEAGVDCALNEEPVNRLADSDPAPAPPPVEVVKAISAAAVSIPRPEPPPLAEAPTEP